MEMTGEQRIAAPRQRVWEALNDPEILKQCIPGCQSIEKSDENTFSARVKAKVGPVNSTFSGNVTLSDLNPPESYTISGQGSGGAAGFAKGSAHVSLEDDGAETVLRYKVDAQVGGKLAQVGQRLIQSTANKYAKQFFDTFTEKVGAAQTAKTTTEQEAEARASSAGTASAQPAPTADESAQVHTAEGAATPAAEATPEQPAAGEAPASSPEQPRQPATEGGGERRGLDPRIWITGVIAVAIILLAILSA